MAAGLLVLAAGGCAGTGGRRQAPLPEPDLRARADSLAADSLAAAMAADSLAVADSLAALEFARSAVPPVLFAPRALWVVRHDLADPRTLADTIEWAANTGFTDILLQVRGRGDAYYASALVPRAEEIAGDEDLNRDPLAEAIAAAHARGLRVHAWINVFLAWSASTAPRSFDHLVNLHPDWFVWFSPRRGSMPRSTLDLRRRELEALELEGHFLIPSHPGVGEHLEAVTRELVANYAIDGLHLDYARLPKMVKSYDPVSRAAFRFASGYDPLNLLDRRALRAGVGAAEAERLEAAWQRWNEDQVTGVVARIAAAAREVRPGITISAAVYPPPAHARSERGQAWDQWLDTGIIDVAVPMCYAPDAPVVRSDLEVARAATRGRLWAGLGVYNKPLHRALADAGLAAGLGYEGVAIFSHGAAREAGLTAGATIAAALSGFAAAGGGVR